MESKALGYRRCLSSCIVSKARYVYVSLHVMAPLRKLNDLELLGEISHNVCFRDKGMKNVLGTVCFLTSVCNIDVLQMFRSLF